MKKEVLVALTAFFLMSLSTMTAVYAGVDKNEEQKTVITQEAELSGKEIKETIKIKGIRYEEEAGFFKELSLEVEDDLKKTVKVDLEPGFDPRLKIIDFNDDGNKELLVKINSEDSGENASFYLYSYQDGKLINLGVPDPVTSTAQLEDNYEAVIAVENENREVTFDLAENAKAYEKLGLYHKGKLNEPFELTVNSYNMLTPFENTKGEKGLKGMQRVTGIDQNDTIAYLQSFWKREDEKWQLVNVEILDVRNK
ncbi:hypothetical protein MKX67_11565 [Cytobacillus sp. FSL W7-1323]|uniref:Spore coat protein n=1 Tax=Cytobacillus kochii TaxID=859143 RepID=A0A248TNT2_9BACI|nr:hypothetical protein [Cytobacillus kochii]ASV69750.1 hypothetical protein CKF48_22040 [Cytobacillus kochii]MED1606776.1 hypothetical protein [Cytobacillus kochii]